MTLQRRCRSSQPCPSTAGQLTEAGRSALSIVRSELIATNLARSYGCPECVDRPLFAFLLPGLPGCAVQHSYDPMLVERVAEAGLESQTPARDHPPVPASVIKAHAIFGALVGALASCKSTDLVTVIDPCVPER